MDMMDVVKGLGGLSGAGGGQANAVGALLALVNGSGGGLGGLVQAFQKNGLGDLVASWVGTGQNLPISPEQIEKVLGSQQLSQFASQAGVPAEAARATLASMLPALIDKLTPDGQLPARNELPGLDVLAKLLS
jgi:uncharacterized protein YidB (DUF937 family)